MNYAYEWTVTDSFSNTHIIKLKKEEVNRYIFFDGEHIGIIPNTSAYSELFGYEFYFKVLDMQCKIVKFGSLASPKLVVNDVFVDTGEKYLDKIHPISMCGIVGIILDAIICLVLSSVLFSKYGFEAILMVIGLWSSFPLVWSVGNMPVRAEFSERRVAITRSVVFAIFYAVQIGYVTLLV